MPGPALSSRGANLSLSVGVEGADANGSREALRTSSVCAALPALLMLDMGLTHGLSCFGALQRKWLGYGSASSS